MLEDTRTPSKERPLVTSAQPTTTVLDTVPLKRALISVYDKTGLEELATGLHAAGVQIVSTGSTAQRIAAAGVPVTEVAEVTGFQECLDGRVKTLHPRVHAGILADRRREDHVTQLRDLEVEPFDLVVVNLYPFVDTVNSGAAEDAVVEQIDIGGPSMVRAAAKNHASVAIVVDPARYGEVVQAAQSGGFDLRARRRLAALAFAHTAAYDVAVSTWMAEQGTVGATPDASVESDATGGDRPAPAFAADRSAAWELAETLRYGHYSVAGEFVYDRPFQWGSKRTGPDLARVGGLRKRDNERVRGPVCRRVERGRSEKRRGRGPAEQDAAAVAGFAQRIQNVHTPIGLRAGPTGSLTA